MLSDTNSTVQGTMSSWFPGRATNQPSEARGEGGQPLTQEQMHLARHQQERDRAQIDRLLSVVREQEGSDDLERH